MRASSGQLSEGLGRPLGRGTLLDTEPEAWGRGRGGTASRRGCSLRGEWNHRRRGGRGGRPWDWSAGGRGQGQLHTWESRGHVRGSRGLLPCDVSLGKGNSHSKVPPGARHLARGLDSEDDLPPPSVKLQGTPPPPQGRQVPPAPSSPGVVACGQYEPWLWTGREVKTAD